MSRTLGQLVTWETLEVGVGGVTAPATKIVNYGQVVKGSNAVLGN